MWRPRAAREEMVLLCCKRILESFLDMVSSLDKAGVITF